MYNSFSKFKRLNSDNGRLSVKKQVIYVKNHLLKLMFSYWFIYIIFAILGFAFGVKFYGAYDLNPIYFIIDFLGLANLFNTPTFNATWWFMSLIIILYIIYPILDKVLNYSPELLLSASCLFLLLPENISNRAQIRSYLIVFVLGMYLSKINGIERLSNKLNTKIKLYLFCFLSLLCTAYIRHYYLNDSVNFDSIFALVVVLISFAIISKIPILNRVLFQLGKYSASIFMFHTFIYSKFLRDFIYGFEYAPIIFIIMILLCYIIAVVLEWLKNILKINKLLEKACNG